MNSTSKDITTLLDNDSSLALTYETDLFYNNMPDDPNNLVAIYDNAGAPPMLQLEKDVSNYYYDSITVWVRNITFDNAYSVAFNIMQFLHGTSQEVIAGTYYALIRSLGNPRVLHKDENQRQVVVVSFEVQRRPN